MLSQNNAVPKLVRVIEHGDVEQFDRLLGGECDVNAPMGRDGWPPICCAVASRKRTMIAKLLKRGADPNHAIERGLAQGMVALDFCQDIPIAKMLINAGARLDIYDRHGRTPLDWAFCMARREMVALFAEEPISS